MGSLTGLGIHLSLEQSSLLLEALMEQPFKQVFEVIGSLNTQAQQFYQTEEEKNRTQLFMLDPAEFTLCIKALGELPYNRVSGLIQNLHQQLHAQMQQAAALNSQQILRNACHEPSQRC